MSDISTFESRTGKVKCTAEEMYHFLTDIRNFERFIPKDKFSDIIMDKDSCSFSVSMIGKVSVRISNKKEFSEVDFSGNAMLVNDFSLVARLSDTEPSHSGIRLSVQAYLNPFLGTLAADPINKLLENLVAEMEKFDGWKEIRIDN